MQRFRSFRDSFRRRRDKVSSSGSNGVANGSSSTINQWHSDEISVRQGNCTFPIKYLGCVEVFESRGMPICEEALKVLRSTKRKAIKGTLFITGDGLRVVDGETRGLIVDQTIEKVSFCAPDRNNERGFAYICRDGTTRRWMCHGFHAIGNTGERLSHAVGCAFAICLERKQKRDRDAAELAAAAALLNQNKNPHMNGHPNNHNSNIVGPDNTHGDHLNGMNQNGRAPNNHVPPHLMAAAATSNGTTLTWQSRPAVRDPQVFRFTEPPPMKPVINPYAIDRPHATPLMLQRQTSFRPLSNLRSQTPFKRQLSLKLQAYQKA